MPADNITAGAIKIHLYTKSGSPPPPKLAPWSHICWYPAVVLTTIIICSSLVHNRRKGPTSRPILTLKRQHSQLASEFRDFVLDLRAISFDDHCQLLVVSDNSIRHHGFTILEQLRYFERTTKLQTSSKVSKHDPSSGCETRLVLSPLRY